MPRSVGETPGACPPTAHALDGAARRRATPKTPNVWGQPRAMAGRPRGERMSITHLHLLLNHAPVVGSVGLVLLLALAGWRHSTELGKVSLGLTVALAG